MRAQWLCLLVVVAVFQSAAAESVPPRPPLRVVMDDNYPPYVFRDSNGALNGYLPDMWQAWSKTTGVPIELTATDWEKAQQIMAAGGADVIDTMFFTYERERRYDFLAPYERIPVAIYTHVDIAGIADLNTLRGFLVGVKAGDACITHLRDAGIDSVRPYQNYDALVGAAVAGQIKVFCLDEPPANYLVYRAHAEDQFRKAFSLYVGEFHRAVQKGDSATLALVKSGFDAIPAAEEQALRDKWMGSELDYSPYGRYLVYAAFAGIVVVALLSIWSLMLRRMVAQRTRQLEHERTHLRSLVETIPDLVWLKDADGVYLNCNSVVERLFGAKAEQIIGRTDYDFFDREQADSFREHDRRAVEAGHALSNEESVIFADDGQRVMVETIKTPMYDAQGKLVGILGIARDITQRKRDEAQISQLAHYDALTGLPNRTLLDDRIGQAISMAQRSGDRLSVMLMDLDHFKKINDGLGHRVGDELLVAIAKRLKASLREEDTVSRLGGDEFIVLLPDTDAEGAAHVAAKLLDKVGSRHQVDGHELSVSLSIGIAVYPNDGSDFNALYRSAEVAMYRGKSEGRNGFRFYAPEMQTRLSRTLQLEGALRKAIERNELALHFQPQLSLRNGRVIGAEVLLRWTSAELGHVSPAEFIPVAEESDLIQDIGDWVLRGSIDQLRQWREQGFVDLTLSVNLSAAQFRHVGLPEEIMSILHAAQVPPQYLELELTEGVAMDDPVAAIAVMDELHRHGVRFAIDDFGTGYSSLSYLKRFQVCKLKIDQSFVRDISIDPEDKAIVNAIIHLAESLDMDTIAEGVETAEQLDYLREQGCDEVQGFYFSKPLPAAEFVAFLQANSA